MKYVLMLVLVCISTLAQGKEYEAYYQDLWCNGEVEVTLSDNSRADCLTEDEAIEVDFAHKWAESIGQALLYARLIGKTPAVLLIVNEDSADHLARFHNASDGLGIRLYIIHE